MDITRISAIQEALQWSGCVTREFKGNGFCGGSFLPEQSQTLDYSKSVFYFHDAGENITILLDGHIYNYSEVTQKLGGSSETSTTPALVFSAFMKWGDRFVEHLNGDFAICIFHNKTRRAFFFRDHLGVHPLAISVQENCVYFATDPMGLCYALDEGYPSEQYLVNQFLIHSRNRRMFPNSKVELVLPGHFARVSAEKIQQFRYWFPEKNQQDKSISCSRAVEYLDFLVRDSVHIRSGFGRAAAHISGGIDSGVIAALAREEHKDQKDFFGFSWSPDYNVEDESIEFDERERVRDTCMMNNITPVFVNFSENDRLRFLENWRYPSNYTYENKVLSNAREKGVRILFSGWGGDEFVSIGHRGLDASLIKEFAWKTFFKKYPVSDVRKLIGALLFQVIFPSWKRSYAKNKTLPVIFPYLKNTIKTNRIPVKQRKRFGSRRVVHLELLNYGHLDNRTTDWYVHGRRYGVEYRYPLLDKRIVEYMLKIPTRCLVSKREDNNYRLLLRIIGKDKLPQSVLKNASKEDPVRQNFISGTVDNIRILLLSEADSMLSNPLLQFLDMDLLRKDIDLYRKTGDQEAEKRITSMLFLIKGAHVFINQYSQKIFSSGEGGQS